ncbi:MAG: site-2 protease family protein [Bacteroidia bacterium]
MDQETKNDRLYAYIVLGVAVAAAIIGIATGHGDLVLDILKGAGLMMLAITILVTIHELGHFWAAKAFGMRVETFSIGFPPVIWKTKRGETEYQIGMIPLGGYVKISGIIDESLDESNMQSEAQPWEFRAKPIWQRLIVMVGGVTMNVILGVLVFAAMKFFFGETRTPVSALKHKIEVTDIVRSKDKDGKEHCRTTLGYYLGLRSGDSLISFSGQKFKYVEEYQNPQLLMDGGYYEVKRGDKIEKVNIPLGAMNLMSADTIAPVLFDLNYPSKIEVVEDKPMRPAQKAGLKTGDMVVKMDSTPVQHFKQLKKMLDESKANQNIVFTVLREGKELQIPVQTDADKKIGVAPVFEDTAITYNLGQSLAKGSSEAFGFVSANAKGFGKMASGEVKASKSVMGPLGIAKKYLEIFTKGGWKGFLFLTGMLSMILAFMNILPIPALDGGHVVFLLVEAIMRREPPLKVRMVIQQIGMVLLLLLMVAIIGNDFITHLFGGGPQDICK